MKPTARPKNGKGAPGTPAALRALRRAAQKVHAENRSLGLPLILWQDGKVVETGMNTEDARKCAAKQGIAEEEALKTGLEAKAKEFVEKGAEVYAKV